MILFLGDLYNASIVRVHFLVAHPNYQIQITIHGRNHARRARRNNVHKMEHIQKKGKLNVNNKRRIKF